MDLDVRLLEWLAGAGILVGLFAGLCAYRWKRRSRILWMLYGALSFGAAVAILALLPRRERRRLLPQRERNWHR